MSIERKKRAQKTLIVLLIIVSICCLAPLFIFVVPYNNFEMKEKDAVLQFDSLNEAILATIKPPRDAEIIYRNTTGIITPPTMHGRQLSVQYNLGDMNASQILSYYNNQLIEDNWRIRGQSLHGASYYRNNACFGVLIQDQAEFKNKFFEVDIWYDFFSQSFSPPVPWWFGWDDGDTTLSLYELLEMDHRILRCPGN